MLQLAPLLLALAITQEPKGVPHEPDDESVPGFPEGEAPALPERVHWELTKPGTVSTATRHRISLDGLWRFAAVSEHDSPVARAEMGWIEMPGHWIESGTKVYDPRFRLCDGLWRGKPLEEFAWAWAERDITVVNTLKWLDHRIFLVVRGPWVGAEVYISQRIDKSRVVARDREVPAEDAVYVEPISGVDRDGQRWFEITESLIYPGTSQVSMRLKADVSQLPNGMQSGPEPYIGLEFVPTGPRVERIELRRDDKRDEIEATFELMRPKGFPLLPGPPIHTIPMVLRLRLEDSASGRVVQSRHYEIGKMPDLTRTVSLRIPWSNRADQSLPEQARLRVYFGPKTGGAYAQVQFAPQPFILSVCRMWLPVWFRPPGIYDEPFPVKFEPSELGFVEVE